CSRSVNLEIDKTVKSHHQLVEPLIRAVVVILQCAPCPLIRFFHVDRHASVALTSAVSVHCSIRVLPVHGTAMLVSPNPNQVLIWKELHQLLRRPGVATLKGAEILMMRQENRSAWTLGRPDSCAEPIDQRVLQLAVRTHTGNLVNEGDLAKDRQTDRVVPGIET